MPRTAQEMARSTMDQQIRRHVDASHTALLNKLQTDPAMTNTRDPNLSSVDYPQLANPVSKDISGAQNSADRAQNSADRAQSTADRALNTANGISIPTSTRPALSGANQHSHTISFTPFIKLSREERIEMLGDREALENLLVSGSLTLFEAIQAKNTLNTLRIVMDYTGFDAFERERRFTDPEWAEWSDAYKRVFGVDEYRESDRDNYLSYGNVRMDPHDGIAETSHDKV